MLTGDGDVLEPEDGLIGIGSGGPLCARRGPRAGRCGGSRCRGDRPQGDDDRRRHLRLHQPQHRLREAMTANAFSPREIVSELDRYIVGQHDAKRAVAIALRNRWRRQQLSRSPARGGAAEEHPDDRPDRRRQDRDRAPPRPARPGAFPQGRGDQVHRGGLCRPRCRADRARPGRDRHRHDPRAPLQGSRPPRPNSPPRSGCSMRWSARTPAADTRAEVPQDAARGRARRPRDRGPGAAKRAAARLPTFEIPGMPGAPWACSISATSSARLSATA